jgi:hypothetical protein
MRTWLEMSIIGNYYAALSNLRQTRYNKAEHSSLPQARSWFHEAKVEVIQQKELQKKLNFYLYNWLKALLNIDNLLASSGFRHWHGGLYQYEKRDKGSVPVGLETDYENIYGDVQWVMDKVHESKYNLKLFDTGWDVASEIGVI